MRVLQVTGKLGVASNDSTGSARTGSIAAHPLFPAIVALWFAALLGLGSLVIPHELFLRLFGADATTPAVRGAVALASALGGAGLGYALARKVAASSERPTRRERSGGPRATPAKRPISAIEELGPEGLDEPVGETRPHVPAPEPIAGRRRPLSVTDESGPSEFLDHVPLPGGSDGIGIMHAEPLEEEEPLELAHFADEPEPGPVRFTPPGGTPFGTGALSRRPDDLNVDRPFTSTLASGDAPPVAVRPFDAPLSSQASATNAPFEVIAAEVERPGTDTSTVAAESHLPFGMPQPVGHAATINSPGPASDRQSAAALANLSVAQLVERFALSLQRAGEPTAAALLTPEPQPEPVLAPAGQFAPVPAPLGASSTSAVPLALQPFGFDDEEDGDEADSIPPFALPLGVRPDQREAVAAYTSPAALDDVPGDDTADEDDHFASLLEMRGRIGANRDAVRIDLPDQHDGIEPVVVFPGQEPRRAVPASDGPTRDAAPPSQPDLARPAPFASPQAQSPQAGAALPRSDATEAALREALAKLQRLSGAA